MQAAEARSGSWRGRRPYLIAAGAGAAVFVVVAALMLSGALDAFDLRVITLFVEHRRQPFTAVAETLDKLDWWWLLGLIVVGLLAGLWWTGRKAQAAYLAATAVAALVLNPLLKQAFERARPSGHALVTVSSAAFPSGHTTTATAMATALAVIAWPTRWRWPVLVAAIVFAPVMALSRVYLGVHWPSDVLGGLALGFTIAMAVRGLFGWPFGRREEDASSAVRAVSDRAGTAGRVSAGERAGAQGIDVVFLDWGNTLMVDNGMRRGPMKDWEQVEAEAGAQEALRRLRARYRLVVATNAEDSPAPSVRQALARVDLDKYIDDVISSADVGDHKPNYGFYRAALLHEGTRGVPLDPRRAVMVGDGTTNDIAGAQRAGMRTVWYNPTRRPYPQGAQPPDAEIRRLADLPAAVDRLAGVRPEKHSRRRRKTDGAAPAGAEAAEVARALRAQVAAEDAAASAAAAFSEAPETEGAPRQQPPEAADTRAPDGPEDD